MRVTVGLKAASALLLTLMLHLSATETRVIVRAKAKDAKFIGTGMGGVFITIREARTGKLLADGLTVGSTGNTTKIMKQAKERSQAWADESSARFEATLDLERPTLVEIRAEGPEGQLQGAAMASVQQWLLPGKHVVKGDAILLEIPGFIVDIKEPPIHGFAGKVPTEVTVSANLVLMCGCPTEPDGLWNSNRYEIEAILSQNGKEIGRYPMSYSGKTSQFEAKLPLTKPGAYELLVQAFDPETGNAGVDRSGFILGAE